MRVYNTISCSVTGYRKQLAHSPCEDAIKVVHLHKGTIIAVADGHGDARCSFASIGAKLATCAACSVLGRYLKGAPRQLSKYWNSRRNQIAAEIWQNFALRVVEDYRVQINSKLSDEMASMLRERIKSYFCLSDEVLTSDAMREKYTKQQMIDKTLERILFLYGTTIRASVLTETYLFNCALGDGDTIALIDDRVEWLLPQTEPFGTETASLCEPAEDVVDSFLFSYVSCVADALQDGPYEEGSVFVPTVILATDGLRNSFFSEAGFKEKVKELSDEAHSLKKPLRQGRLKRLCGKLSRESVFQDDVSTVIATRAEGLRNYRY